MGTASLTRKQLMEMAEDLLRTVVRERVHHTMELQLYHAIYEGRKLKPEFGNTARKYLSVWEERGLPADYPDIGWCHRLLEIAENVKAGRAPGYEGVQPSPFSAGEMETVRKLIYGRRSIRQWEDRPVPDELIDKILDAGMQAPNGCNMQIVRFIVMRKPETLRKFHNLEFGLEPVKIVLCTDSRVYRLEPPGPPDKNRILDVGSYMAHMLLMAHALGLGAVWSTFDDRQIDGIRGHFGLPEYIDVVTYMSVGWPKEKVLPPARISFKDAVLVRE
jgi:nitroreductase